MRYEKNINLTEKLEKVFNRVGKTVCIDGRNKFNKLLIMLDTVYRDFVNDFMTAEYMAEYYQLEEHDLNKILDLGKRVNHNKNLKFIYRGLI